MPATTRGKTKRFQPKPKIKKSFLLSLRRQLDCNDPDGARDDIKKALMALKPGSTFLIHDVVSKSLEKWLKFHAAQLDVSISFCGRRYNYNITTIESREAERRESQRQSDALTDYYNSPG